MEILIFGYAIYHGIIFNILTTMQPHPIYGFCMATQEDSNKHVAIFIIWDAGIVFILIWMFTGKLICGTTRNDITFQKYTIVKCFKVLCSDLSCL